jgi:hypothetical protein
VRGIVVAKEFSPRTIAAARAASNIRLVQYTYRFSFEMISTPSGEGALLQPG